MSGWQRLQELFEGAMALPAEERGDYLDRQCAGGVDAALRARVEALLGATGEGSLLIGEAIGRAAAETVTPSAARRPLEEGAKLGRYEIVRPLGEGGMGRVYRALDTGLDREVAVKLLNAAVLSSEAGRSRFEREARAAAALRHRNIVTVHDIGQAEEQPFIVMELVEGETLREKLQSGVTESDLLQWGVQIADALTTAHESGIVHRDLKPENVIVDADGEARIVDFGIASLGDRPLAGPDDGETLTRLTSVGTLMGTPGYMSPEAVLGKGTDHRSDQFALGAILYELATSERPFQGDSAEEVLAATLREGPEGRPRLDRLPAALRAIVERCLRSDPSERYGRTSELLEALRALLNGGVRGRRPSPPLPRPRTELVGREAECGAIRRLIVDEHVRLVTLTGPGGSGKTRLALQVAAELCDYFPSQVYFVELGAVREPTLVAPAIAEALGAGGDLAPIEAIRKELSVSEARCLVVLDNFEQVVSAARDLAELLAKVEGLTFIVTSREVLRVYGEYDFPVEPLAFPRIDATLGAGDLAKYPAVELFVERARAAKPSFELTDENSAAVAELCARLDGLPLALELAAARARTLAPHEMIDRLESQKGLLSSRARDLPDRQKTLRATLDWSYELVDEDERVLFRRLGVFAGGFTLEAAEAVAGGYGDLAVDVVEGIESLMDKSLVHSLEGPGSDSRFALLETIREFAREKLSDHREWEKTRKAHAAYYVVLAEEGGAKLAHQGDSRWLATFRAEHDNCRAALDWLTDAGEAEWGLRLALGLFDFWDRTGYLVEGQRRFTRLLELGSSRSKRRLRARGLFSVAAFAATRGLVREATRWQHETLELYRELGDLRGQGIVLNALGIAGSTGGFDHAMARRSFTEALEIWNRLGDRIGYARSLSNLAWVLKTEGEHEEARGMYQEAGRLFSAGGNPIDAAWALNHEADVLAEDGDLGGATELYQQALDRFEELGFRWGAATTLADLAAVASRRRDWPESVHRGREALQIFFELGHKRGLSRLFEALSLPALEQGNGEVALTLMTCAGALREQMGLAPAPGEQEQQDRQLQRMVATTGEERAREIQRSSAQLSVAEVVRLALSF